MLNIHNSNKSDPVLNEEDDLQIKSKNGSRRSSISSTSSSTFKVLPPITCEQTSNDESKNDESVEMKENEDYDSQANAALPETDGTALDLSTLVKELDNGNEKPQETNSSNNLPEDLQTTEEIDIIVQNNLKQRSKTNKMESIQNRYH